MMQVTIKRRVATLNVDKRPIPGKFQEAIEVATLLSKTNKGAFVTLSNGDVIYRKAKDILNAEA